MVSNAANWQGHTVKRGGRLGEESDPNFTIERVLTGLRD